METVKHDWKLDSIPSGFCHVQHDGVSIKLISYETCVCWFSRFTNIITGEEVLYLHCRGNYTKASIRHISRFTKEFTGASKYVELRDLLERASRCYKNEARLNDKEAASMYDAGAVYIKLTSKEIEQFDKRLTWYKENGKRFTKYSRKPNYETIFYFKYF